MSEPRGLFSPENLQAFVAVAFVVALMALSVAFFQLQWTNRRLADVEGRITLNEMAWRDLASRLDRVALLEGTVARLDATIKAQPPAPAPAATP